MDTRIILAITVMIIILVIILFVVVNIGGRRIDISKRTEILKRLEELGLATGSLEGSTRRDAVVKLDNLLSKALQIKYNNTLSCGDNLKKAKDFFSKKDYNDLWNVHKIRNSIVHDDYEINEEEADEVFKIYKSNIIKILK
mgnify:CR=1 FL=1